MGSGVCIRLTGSMPEKFIREALASGVRIAQCRRIDACLTEMYVPRRDAPKVLRLAERYHLRCERVGCAGTASLAEILLRRRTALLGGVMMLAVSALLLSRVWMVQVLPADDADDALLYRVAQVLAESGAEPGANLHTLDRARLRSHVISRVPEAGYVAVKRQGVCIVAEVSGAVSPPATYDLSAARDIVALHDGVVQRVDVYAGTAAVKPGDVVRRGDVLIRGEERIAQETAIPVAAEGAVVARIWQSAEVRCAMEQTVSVPTGRVHTSEALRLLKWTWPHACVPEYARERTEEQFLPMGGVFLPVGIVRTKHIECRDEVQRRDEETAKRQLLEEAEAILDKNMPFHAVVVDKWQDYSMISSGELYMKLTRELEADIAASGRAE